MAELLPPPIQKKKPQTHENAQREDAAAAAHSAPTQEPTTPETHTKKPAATHSAPTQQPTTLETHTKTHPAQKKPATEAAPDAQPTQDAAPARTAKGARIFLHQSQSLAQYKEPLDHLDTIGMRQFINNAQHSSMFFEYFEKICKLLNISTKDSRNSIVKFILIHIVDIPNTAEAISQSIDAPEGQYVDEDGLAHVKRMLQSSKSNVTDRAGSTNIWKFLYAYIAFNPLEKQILRSQAHTMSNKVLSDIHTALLKCKVQNITWDTCCRLALLPRTTRLQSMSAITHILRCHALTTNQPEAAASNWATTYATNIIDTRYSPTTMAKDITDIVKNMLYLNEDGFTSKYNDFVTGAREFKFTRHTTLQGDSQHTTDPVVVDTNNIITPTQNRRLRLQAICYNTHQRNNDKPNTANTTTNSLHKWKQNNKIPILLSVENTRFVYFLQSQKHLLDDDQRTRILLPIIANKVTLKAIIESSVPDKDNIDPDMLTDHISKLQWNKSIFPEMAEFTKIVTKYAPVTKSRTMTRSDWLHMYIYAYQQKDPCDVNSTQAYCINQVLEFYSPILAIHIKQFTATTPFNAGAYQSILEAYTKSLRE
jgi:hypothetical protein